MFSFEPISSIAASKKLLLLVVPYLLVSSLRRAETLEALVLVLVAMADVGALVGLWQYAFSDLGDLNHRIHGFVGHYMTYSGLLMGVGVLALAGAVFQSRYRLFLLGSLLVIFAALVLTLTRSAWIGMLVTSTLLLFLRNRRLLLAVPAIALAIGVLLPRDVERRLASFVRPDTSGWDRLYMLDAGGAIVRNHPVLGVGPGMVPEVYPLYVRPDAPHNDNLHLHNNIMQIAAERGLPSLASWLWFVGLSLVLSVRALRRARTDRSRALSAGALGVLIAAFLAGLFEYNFGDSEFQMLYLFAMTIPIIVLRSEHETLDKRADPKGA
jgi:O-antigen ligase